jgi:diguanylate cyclase (GGDEF)-like protein
MAALYYLSGLLSLSVFHANELITMSAFFPEGFALAAILIFGKKVLPGIFLGQFLLALSSHFPVMAGIIISLSNTLEAYIALQLFTRMKLHTSLTTLRDLFGLILIIILILQPFSAAVGNSTLYLFGILGAEEFSHSTFYWWIGNILGQIILTPLLLLLYHERSHLPVKGLLLTIIITLFGNYLLQITLGITNLSLLLMITLPITIFLGTKNLLYGLTASVSLAMISLYFAHQGIGTFSHASSPIDNLLDLNYFTVSHIILVLLVGVLFKENEASIQKLKAMAHFDYLTGLPNRHILREEIHHAVTMAEEHGFQSAICFIDLDGFKQINDQYGHFAGDETLKEVTHRLKHFVSAKDSLLRIGGDEFLIILNHIEDKEQVDHHLRSLIARMEEPIHYETNSFPITFSIGVSFCPKHGMTVKELMEKADHAMYCAKERGKNQVCYA